MRVYDQPDYPLLLAITNATTWELVQKETTRGPMVFGFISTVSLIGMFISLIRGLRGSQQACLAGVVILSLPSLAQIGASQYADVPEACYFLASAGIMLLYLRWRTPRLPLVAGLMVGLGAWAKNEGVVFAASNFLVWSYLSWRDRSPAIRDFILGAAPALVVLGLFKVFLAPRSDAFGYPAAMLASFLDPTRYLDVLSQIGSGFWRDPGAFPVLALVLVAYAAVMARSPQGVQGLKPLAFTILAQAVAYLLIYVGTPYAYGTASMIPTSIGRLSMHLIPLVLAGLFLWLRSPTEIDFPGMTPDGAASNAGV